MGWWSDGTSNQIIFGEKHIPISRFEITYYDYDVGPEPPGIASAYYTFDSSYIILTNHDYWGRSSYVRNVWNTASMASEPTIFTAANFLFLRPTEGERSNGHNVAFSSWHPGTCNFLLGDGSVRGVSVTTPYRLISFLGCVNDGNSVALP